MSEILNTIQQTTSNLTKSAGDTFNSLQKSTTETLNSVQSQISEFSSTTTDTVAKTGFLDANGLIAKFGFLILVIIIFLIMLNLGIRLIYYFTTPTSNWVYLIKGMIDGNNYRIISQDPAVTKDIVSRSNNQTTGIEFTWAVWLRLDGFPPPSVVATHQPIFVKGGPGYNKMTGIMTVSNGPGVYFVNGVKNEGFNTGLTTQNTIEIIMDTVSNVDKANTQTIRINNVPIQKWFHLCIRCENKYLDVYMNGIVSYRLALNNVPLQNYNNVEVCGNGGYNGKLSNLLYYNRALNIVDINGLVSSGPNTTNADANKGVYGGDYLSSLWYT